MSSPCFLCPCWRWTHVGLRPHLEKGPGAPGKTPSPRREAGAAVSPLGCEGGRAAGPCSALRSVTRCHSGDRLTTAVPFSSGYHFQGQRPGSHVDMSHTGLGSEAPWAGGGVQESCRLTAHTPQHMLPAFTTLMPRLGRVTPWEPQQTGPSGARLSPPGPREHWARPQQPGRSHLGLQHCAVEEGRSGAAPVIVLCAVGSQCLPCGPPIIGSVLHMGKLRPGVAVTTQVPTASKKQMRDVNWLLDSSSLPLEDTGFGVTHSEARRGLQQIITGR